MSVRTGDRSDGTLGVLNDIANLGAYTIQICRSEKVFPKSSRWVMAKPIVDECRTEVLVRNVRLYLYQVPAEKQDQTVPDPLR